MTSQNVVNGKAYEWAIARQFSIQLGGSDQIGADLIIDSEASRTALHCFRALDIDQQILWNRCATAGVDHVIAREVLNPTVESPSAIVVASDARGIEGDVRDVLVTSTDGTSLGVSCKNNHDAFKHPRLSGTIDFAKEWGLSPDGCSPSYWASVTPIFDRLAAIRTSSGGEAKFSDIKDLRSDVMKPIAVAFVDELSTQLAKDPTSEARVCGQLVKYVVGKEDFYKIIKDDLDRHVRVMGFNFNGSLTMRKPKLPKALVGISLSKDSYETGNSVSVFVQLDLGYAFKMRLHTASSRVEPSLKFDVQAVGLPPRDIYQNFIRVG